MKVEILLSFLENIVGTARIIAAFAGIAIAVSAITSCVLRCEKDGYDYSSYMAAKRVLRHCSIVFSMAILFAITPRLTEIQEMRINLIKLGLSSPESLNKGIEEIRRIGEKLECKYLGCDENK